MESFNDFFSGKLYEKHTDLCKIMNEHGSDKGSGWHNYTTFYDYIFKDMKDDVKYIFELGLGSINPSIPSNMASLNGVPCASVRGWRDYFSNAIVYGADIDTDILHQEDRIITFECDQGDSEIIKNMWDKIDVKFDIIIDDGVHHPTMNKIFFDNSIDKLRDGGLYIIEDIHKKYFNDFNLFIDENQGRFKSIELIKIPNDGNKADNNIILIEK